MKKIQWILALRYMRRQKSACLSMFIVAMLAVTAYLGINYSAAAMKANGERFWDMTAFRDIEIVSPTLLTEEDVEKIAGTRGVQDAEAVWYVTANVASNPEAGVDVVSLTEKINTVILTEGRMPETAGECLLEPPVLEALGLSVGDTIELEANPALSQTRFKVCGVAEHADHACVPLHVPGNRYAIVRREAFDMEKLRGSCMKAVVRIEGAEGSDRFSNEYLEKAALVCKRLDSAADQAAYRRLIWNADEDEDVLKSMLNMALASLTGVHPWLVLDVWGSSCYYAIRSAAENVADMGTTFAVMFVIVGALVIYASVSRMVEEDRLTIGMAKAMGVTGKEIAVKYLTAGLLPTVAGMLAGIAAAYAVIQRIVLTIYGKLYVYGTGLPAFKPDMTIAVFAVGVLIAAAAATIACIGLLRTPAVKLMNERSPESRFLTKAKSRGKTDTAGLSLYAKMIIRSIRAGKRRILVIVAGIAGCTVLLVTGFTIRLAVAESLVRQFSDVELYDLKIVFDPTTGDNGQPLEERIISVLAGAGLYRGAGQEGWVEVSDRNCLFTAGGRMNGGELICGAPETLDGYIAMTDIESGDRMELSSDPGVYIHLRTSETTGLAPGDRLTLYDDRMNPVRVTIAGVFNNYVGGQMIISEAAYEAVFDEKPERNCFLVKCGEAQCAVIEARLRELPVTVTESETKQEEYKSYTSALDLIAGVLAIIAALMAGGVLLNLIYLQYYRKKRSLVIMRINGFTAKETAGYVLGESAVTHVLGIILGILGGAWLGRRIICLMEARQLHIVRHVQPMGWLLSVCIMLLFSFVIHAVIVRAVVRLKPTEDVMIR